MCVLCGKEMREHSFLSCSCPKYDKYGEKVGYLYGQEYQTAEEKAEFKIENKPVREDYL